VKWDVLNDEQPPYDFLTLLQKSQFKTELMRTFAQRRYEHNLLVKELARLLEPSAEFTRLAVANIETRNLTPNVIESWKPVVASAIGEWAKQRTLASVLTRSPAQEEPNLPPTEGKQSRGTLAEIIHTGLEGTSGQKGPRDQPERYDLRKKFWEGLLSRPQIKTTRHANLRASEYSYIAAGGGVWGLQFKYVVRQDEGTVDLYIDRGRERTRRTRIFSTGCTSTRKRSIRPSAGGCRGSGSTTSRLAGSRTRSLLAATGATRRNGLRSTTP
jgi:hypothetical protein